MEEFVDKRLRIQDAAIALFHEQGVGATSVNEIVKRANVAKGTFYIYYKDKKELISQILTRQHGCLLNDILNRSYEKAVTNSTRWEIAFMDELITYHIAHPKLLKMIQENISFILDTREHRDVVFSQAERLSDFLALLQRQNESLTKTLTRFQMMMEIVGFVCYNAIYFEQPNTMEEVLPELKRTMLALMKGKE